MEKNEGNLFQVADFGWAFDPKEFCSKLSEIPGLEVLILADGKREELNGVVFRADPAYVAAEGMVKYLDNRSWRCGMKIEPFAGSFPPDFEKDELHMEELGRLYDRLENELTSKGIAYRLVLSDLVQERYESYAQHED